MTARHLQLGSYFKILIRFGWKWLNTLAYYHNKLERFWCIITCLAANLKFNKIVFTGRADQQAAKRQEDSRWLKAENRRGGSSCWGQVQSPGASVIKPFAAVVIS